MIIKDIGFNKYNDSINTPALLNKEIIRITSLEKKMINKIQKISREIQQVLELDDKVQMKMLIKKLNYYCEKQKAINEEKSNIMLCILNKIKKENDKNNNKDMVEEKPSYDYIEPKSKKNKTKPVHYRMHLKNFYTKRIKR